MRTKLRNLISAIAEKAARATWPKLLSLRVAASASFAGYRPLRYTAPESPLEFQWDPNKAAVNLEKHGLSFDEASTAFGDPLSRTIADPAHSDEEDRSLLLGLTFSGRLVVVSFVARGEAIRLISARFASRRERRDYEHGPR